MTTEPETPSLAKRIRRHVSSREHRFFASVPPGFESTAANELRDMVIGANPVVLPGGVEFTGKLDACYRANISCRTAGRILMRIAEFRDRRFARLRKHAGDIPWELYLAPGTPVVFSTTSHESRLFHTGRIEIEFRRAVTARLAEAGFEAVFPDEGADLSAVQRVFIRFDGDLCTVSIDSSGEALHRRGYKLHVEVAPLRENIAAALLLEAGIDRCDLLMDPMTGSGTFSLEAGLIALNRPPGLQRSFAFERWPAYSAAACGNIRRKLSDAVLQPEMRKFRIECLDLDPGAVETARTNITRAGLEGVIAPRAGDFFSITNGTRPDERVIIALNPPYGKRLGTVDTARELYAKIGNHIRSHYPRSGFVIITPGRMFETALGLKYDKKVVFTHGGISTAALLRFPGL